MLRDRVSPKTTQAAELIPHSAKAKANWVLKFVKSAVGETDCPDNIPEFIAQRRRYDGLSPLKAYLQLAEWLILRCCLLSDPHCSNLAKRSFFHTQTRFDGGINI